MAGIFMQAEGEPEAETRKFKHLMMILT